MLKEKEKKRKFLYYRVYLKNKYICIPCYFFKYIFLSSAIVWQKYHVFKKSETAILKIFNL